jgi:hypothetical protein
MDGLLNYWIVILFDCWVVILLHRWIVTLLYGKIVKPIHSDHQPSVHRLRSVVNSSAYFTFSTLMPTLMISGNGFSLITCATENL